MSEGVDDVAWVQKTVVHLLEHWAGSQNSLAKEMTRALANDALGHGRKTEGVTGKAISAWKNGRQLPRHHRMLIALRDSVGCRCVKHDSPRKLYSDSVLKTRLQNAQAAKNKARPVQGTTSERSALAQVEFISDSAVRDSDHVTDESSDLRLRLSDVYVERSLENLVLERLPKPGVVVVRGEAGYGKTALMWQFHNRLTGAGRTPLLIPANALLRGTEGGGPGSLTVDTLMTAARVAKRARRAPVILVDTLDLLTHDAAARHEVRRLLETAAGSQVPMVVACRPTEAARLYLDRETPDDVDQETSSVHRLAIQPLLLNLFTSTECAQAIGAYARACYPADSEGIISALQDAQLRGRPLREVVSNPLKLRMLFELYSAEGKRPDVDVDSIGLYNLLWARRVVTDSRDRSTPHAGPDLSVEVQRVALAVLNQGRIELSHTDLLGWLQGADDGEKALRSMRSRGLLVRTDDGWYRFSHQTFFEYAGARAVAALGPSSARDLAQFVAADPYDLLYAEAASQLVLLAGRTAAFPVPEAEKILMSWLQVDDVGLRVLALRTYARFHQPSAELRRAAASALSGADDRACKDFLRLLPSISHTDPSRWQGDLAVLWDRLALRLTIMESLVRLAASHPEAVIDFLEEEIDFLAEEPVRAGDGAGPRKAARWRWLTHRPVEHWRNHDSLHLRVLDAVAEHDPRWACRTALKFWPALAEAGIVAGLTDIIRFLEHHDHREPHAIRTIDTTLRTLRAEKSSIDLQRAYAGLIRLPVREPEELHGLVGEVLATTGVTETWKRARLRAIAEAMFETEERSQALSFLKRIVEDQRDSDLTDLYASLVAHLLSGPYLRPRPSPVTQFARVMCQRSLNEGDAKLTSFFAVALRYSHRDGAVLSQCLPSNIEDPRAWFSEDGLGPLLIDSAALRIASAVEALDWCFTPSGHASVMADLAAAKFFRKLGADLESRVPNAPHLFRYLADYVCLTHQVGRVGAALATTPPDRHSVDAETIRKLKEFRDTLVDDKQPPERKKGYQLWGHLLRHRLSEAPSPDVLASALENTRDPVLINSILSLGTEALEQEAWPEQEAERLISVLREYLTAGERLRRSGTDLSDAQVIQVNREGLARRLLIGLYAQVVPLEQDEDSVRARFHMTASLAFAAGYDMEQKTELNAFTPCATALGRLAERLVSLDPPLAMEALLLFAERLEEIQPGPVHWRQSLAFKWQHTVTALVESLTARKREQLVSGLLTSDQHLATYAVTACVTRDETVPEWIWAIITRLPAHTREELRSRLFENTRERSRRRWHIPSLSPLRSEGSA